MLSTRKRGNNPNAKDSLHVPTDMTITPCFQTYLQLVQGGPSQNASCRKTLGPVYTEDPAV
jgi:hypothetical protein